MLRRLEIFFILTIFAALTVTRTYADEKKSPSPSNTATEAKAAFDAKFNDYKAAIREIEKLQTEFQNADPATRKKLNQTMSAQVAHAHSLINAMVEAAESVYRAAPNADPQITSLLTSVARYETIGRQIGPGEPSPRNPEDVYFPVDGGDQYEKALPILKLLIDGGAKDRELYVWGFLCAVMTNDYDLARTYLGKVKETGALQPIADVVSR
ncbi:MAG TPA: hypothetical protein VFW73_02860, partial [Lacipirellulaceae bacterium]|nr:hypothetical protein [Lacipirellulaceae bacterium]